jgi:UPF0716 protein FxsA
MRFLAAFALISIAEMATFFLVGSRIGFGWALGLALATALIGSYLVRRAGLSVLGRFQTKVNQAQLPGRELTDGASILVAGAFLISPGFITDTLGFLLLVPGIRGLIHRYLVRRLSTRFTIFSDQRIVASDWTIDPSQGDVIDVEVDDLD